MMVKRTYTRNWVLTKDPVESRWFYVVVGKPNRAENRIWWRYYKPWWNFFQPIRYKTKRRCMAHVRLLSRNDPKRHMYAVYYWKRFTSLIRNYLTMDAEGEKHD